MPLRALPFLLALCLSLPARADDPFCLVKVGDCRTGCGADACIVAPVTRFLGLYVSGGPSLWPQDLGGAFSFGLAHNRRFGAEFDLAIPDRTGGLPGGRNLRASIGILGRATLVREGLSGPWDGEGPIPGVALVVAGLAGFGFGDLSGPDAGGVHFGMSAETLFWGWLFLAVRPMLLVDLTSTEPAVPFPFLTVQLGLLLGPYLEDAAADGAKLGGRR